MVIIGMSLAMAFGLPEHPEIYAGLPESARSMMDSGLIPGAVTAILLNLILPGGWRPGDGAG
ncbi:hypothetical protein KBTX_01840 [wastewater metagenome]|uniref:Uncharacterized protein n=4 Tax=root TaxID=1 RepID=A0A5B8RFQ5_9ZZZZ|nr:hypothetical protein KBTEX_01840 [uncultured organism]